MRSGAAQMRTFSWILYNQWDEKLWTRMIWMISVLNVKKKNVNSYWKYHTDIMKVPYKKWRKLFIFNKKNENEYEENNVYCQKNIKKMPSNELFIIICDNKYNEAQ